MVLSRKKLKRKFRALLAQSLAVNESHDSGKGASSAAEADHELQNIRELLTTKSHRTKPSKRGQRGIKKPITDALKNEGGILEGRRGNGENEGLVVMEEKNKNAERKKVKDGGQELEEGFKKEERNFSKKKKDKQKKNKKRRDLKLQRKGKDGKDGKAEKNNEGEIQSMNGLSRVAEVVMPAQVDESEVKKVYVGGIPYYSNEDDIRSFFEGCGTVTEMDCMTFPETGKFRGIAILSFKGGSLMRKGPWTELEDLQLTSYVSLFGERRWDVIAKASGLDRTGKSCRLRWVNYLQPGLKHGRMTPQEEQLILLLHSKWGNRWSRIAASMPGRTDNEIKNYWRTHMRKMAQERKRNSSTSFSFSSSSNFISFSRARKHGETSSLKALLTDKEEEERLKERYCMDQLWNEIETSELSNEICSNFENYHLQECYYCNISVSCDDLYSPQLMDQYYSSVWEECYHTESLKE